MLRTNRGKKLKKPREIRGDVLQVYNGKPQLRHIYIFFLRTNYIQPSLLFAFVHRP